MAENFRYLHTMLRVGDLDRSVAFYCTMFGMVELRRRDVPDGKYTVVAYHLKTHGANPGVTQSVDVKGSAKQDFTVEIP